MLIHLLEDKCGGTMVAQAIGRDAALPKGSLPSPPSARALKVDGVPSVIGELVWDGPGRAVFVTEGEAFLGDIGVCSRGDGSRVRRLQSLGV